MDIIEEISGHFKTSKIELKPENEEGDLHCNSAISTGVGAMDVILGGGYFLGKIYELYGEESAGKTTFTYQNMAEFQKLGGVVLLLESESSFDTERARSLGVDTSKVLRPRFSSFEQGATIIMKTIEKIASLSNYPILIIWDTISASPSTSEIDRVKGKEGLSKVYSDKPILLRSWLRVVSNELSTTNSCLLLVSQVNDIIGGSIYSSQKYEPSGGHGIRHHASARIDVKKSSPIYDKNNEKILIGFKTTMTLWKSKQSPEKQKVYLSQYFDTGFDSLDSLIEYIVATEYQIPGIDFAKAGWIKLDFMGIKKSVRSRSDLLDELSALPGFPIFDFFKFHAYENLKRLHPLSHLITRVNEFQELLQYKPPVAVTTPEI